jgi:hypothetical protein
MTRILAQHCVTIWALSGVAWFADTADVNDNFDVMPPTTNPARGSARKGWIEDVACPRHEVQTSYSSQNVY